jgi:phosphocarrier protein
MKLVKKVRVKNSLGIHTRPATHIIKLLHTVKSNVFFTHKKDTVNAKSLLSILMLALHRNSSVTITVDGEDAQETMEKLLSAFENNFGET